MDNIWFHDPVFPSFQDYPKISSLQIPFYFISIVYPITDVPMPLLCPPLFSPSPLPPGHHCTAVCVCGLCIYILGLISSPSFLITLLWVGGRSSEKSRMNIDSRRRRKLEKYKTQIDACDIQTGSRNNRQLWLRTHRSLQR